MALMPLNQAQRRGYIPTDRETGQLADGYRTRGNSLVRSARELSGMPQESDYLTRAVEGYERAWPCTRRRAAWPPAPTNIRATQRARDQAQRRLDEITPVTSEPAAPTPVEPIPPVPDSQASGPAPLEDAASMAVTYVSASDRDAWLTVDCGSTAGRAPRVCWE